MARRKNVINTKELRETLPAIVERVRQGASFTVLYRSRPAFRLVPVDEAPTEVPLEDDPVYRAEPLGRSSDGRTSADHDALLYGAPHEEAR